MIIYGVIYGVHWEPFGEDMGIRRGPWPPRPKVTHRYAKVVTFVVMETSVLIHHARLWETLHTFRYSFLHTLPVYQRGCEHHPA